MKSQNSRPSAEIPHESRANLRVPQINGNTNQYRSLSKYAKVQFQEQKICFRVARRLCAFTLYNLSTLSKDNTRNPTPTREKMIAQDRDPQKLYPISGGIQLQSSSKVLGRLPFLPLLFLPSPASGPMLIKTFMFERVIVLPYPNIEQGGRGIFSKRENSLF